MAVKPAHARYIKLGPGDAWCKAAFEGNQVHFGHTETPHELCLEGDWGEITRRLVAAGHTQSKATDYTREIRDFYSFGSDCVWITFVDGRLWWAFADPEVYWLGPENKTHGARMRRTLAPWSDKDLRGAELQMDRLSSRLTLTASYRQTICRVKAEDYLFRRLNGDEEPIVAEARALQDGVVKVAATMIAALHWSDFEDLVDLIFARTGWQRVSRLGGTQKDIDLELKEPATGARAFVQVKSQAGQKELSDYISRWRVIGHYDHMFFVCHSPNGDLSAMHEPGVHVWARDRLADMAVRTGLFGWLTDRSM